MDQLPNEAGLTDWIRSGVELSLTFAVRDDVPPDVDKLIDTEPHQANRAAARFTRFG